MSVFDGDWRWALGLLTAAALRDALDGLLARTLHQQTLLGQYLDPLADKMLLSSLFLVLSFVREDSLEVHRGGFRPGYGPCHHRHRALCHRRLPRFSSQHLRKNQYSLPDRGRLLRRAVAGMCRARGCSWWSRFSSTPPSHSRQSPACITSSSPDSGFAKCSPNLPVSGSRHRGRIIVVSWHQYRVNIRNNHRWQVIFAFALVYVFWGSTIWPSASPTRSISLLP